MMVTLDSRRRHHHFLTNRDPRFKDHPPREIQNFWEVVSDGCTTFWKTFHRP